MEEELKETINELYINQQKLINQLINNKEIIKKLDNDIEELLILNKKKKLMKNDEIRKEWEKFINDYNNLFKDIK